MRGETRWGGDVYNGHKRAPGYKWPQAKGALKNGWIAPSRAAASAGFQPELDKVVKLKKATRPPHGIRLLVGPTGS